MSARSANITETNTDTDEALSVSRPLFYILRPDRSLQPLIALDEFPTWLKVLNPDNDNLARMVQVNKDNPYPRNAEYDILCQYCLNATENMDALMERDYAPTNQYAHREPATNAAVRQSAQQGASNLPLMQRSQTRPGISHQQVQQAVPRASQMQSLQLQQGVKQGLQLQSLQQIQLQYGQQQGFLPHLLWWQNYGRTWDRDQQRLTPYRSRPQRCQGRLLALHPQSRSPPNVNASQAEETRGLDPTAPEFVPSAVGSSAAPIYQ
ncbi:uncharacterized protein BHQ10_008212 [Talaromyces amestolkiae]|uniref:Uncharacterized protein n=1 Tax=Talaromyces amestolkiae TaxID=1196081 RepID=A0A364L8R1_TALAM|nr:uncharacterized protein BHQ10_008212 [Talaromyces amestolkiae]RAO72200.1 hypothetical protein BHQ10_008212 [Talaromyces amestolkiae]